MSSLLYKKGFIEKIFNEDNLLEKNLKTICDILKGKQINNKELLKNGKYYMLNGGIKPSGYLNKYNTQANTISISEGGNSCGYVNYNNVPFWSGGHCYTILPKNISNEYLYQLLKFYERKIMDLRVGSGLPNIQKKSLESLNVKIHDKSRQNYISEILKNFDKKNNLEERYQKILEELKKGLMQQLFV